MSGQELSADLVWPGASGRDLVEVLVAEAHHGPLHWRKVARVLERDRLSGLGRAVHLLDFVAALSTELSPHSVIDGYATTPSFTAAVKQQVPAVQARAFALDATVSTLGALLTSDVEWTLGDPLALLRADNERYDLFLASPPFAMRAGNAVEVGGHKLREVADILMWESRRHISPGGSLLMHMPDGFFSRPEAHAILAALADDGLHLRAVVGVDRGLAAASAIPTSLLLFQATGGERPTDLWLGRLDTNTEIPTLVANLLAGKVTKANAHLGELVPVADFHGWRQLALQRELAELLGAEHLQALSDLGSIGNVTLRQGQDYEPPVNAVYVPSMGVGAVTTSPPTPPSRNPYRVVELQLDPALARAEYVATLLSSPLGKRLREVIATGTTIPHVGAGALATVQLPIPPLTAQDQAITAATHLSSMEATVARLRSELWRHPERATRVVSQLESAARADPVRRWLEALPYPLASVLQRYVSTREPEQRVAALLNFFEVTAQFGTAVLLSVARGDESLLRDVQPDLLKAVPPGRQLFDRADFGSWLGLGQTLARNIRRLSGDQTLRPVLLKAVGPAESLMERLSAKGFWAALEPARQVRNQRAHAGLIGSAQTASWLSTLEVQLGQVERALGDAFDDVDLVLAGAARYRNGIHTHSQAQRLRGASSIFDQFELKTRQTLDSEQLTFVSRDTAVSTCLPLVPLVRVGPSTSRTNTACYFFESRRGDAVSYISYHFEDEPYLEVHDGGIDQLVRELEQVEGSQ